MTSYVISIVEMSRSRPSHGGRQSSIDLFDKFLNLSQNDDAFDPLEGVTDYEEFAKQARPPPPRRHRRTAKKQAPDWREGAEKRRTDVWRAVAILDRTSINPKKFFDFTTSEDQGDIFTLSGSTQSDIPFQQYHTGRLAITRKLGNQSCDNFTRQELLNELNDVLGTDYTFSGTPGLASCLQEYLDESCDFGQAYGYLRPWWFDYDFRKVPKLMDRRKVEDREMRKDAMDGDSIINPLIPPRRVWDLYSNRVLPFHALPADDPAMIPDNVWAVSHSWLDERERRLVNTKINDQAWRVPIPKNTNLHDIRIELLNLGAEYVFLDVLCLRQKDEDKPEREYRRKKEWRLDVPTIGYVYQHNARQTVITYFNGLGLPFFITPDIFDSKFHWLKRVWTLQETATNWLPGGLTMDTFKNERQKSKFGPRFYKHLYELVQTTYSGPRNGVFKLIDAIRTREYSNAVDRISGLAYLLRCETLPIYDADVSVEDAWDALVEHMEPRQRVEILFSWGSQGDGIYDWRPSWHQLMDCEQLSTLGVEGSYEKDELLQYLPDAGHLDGSDAYYHYGFIIKSCKLTPFRDDYRSPTNTRKIFADDSDDEEDRRSENDVPEDSETDSEVDTGDERSGVYSEDELEGRGSIELPNLKTFRFDITHFRSPVRRGRYALVGVADFRYWIVGRIVGKRKVAGERAYEISDRKSTRLNSSHSGESRMPSSA